MSFIACFDEAINDRVLHNSTNRLDTEQNCAEITLIGDGPIRILKTDNDLVKLFPLIAKKKGHHCIADYCVFTEKCILICDLKSGKAERAKGQILNTKLLIDYLIKFIRHHYRIEDKQLPKIQYAVFSGIVSKGTAKPGKPAKKNHYGFEFYELGCGGKYKMKHFYEN